MRSLSHQRTLPLIRSLVLASLLAATAEAQTRSFTLEQAMSAPFPSELTAAPTGGGVAWVFNSAGARNLWTAARGRLGTALTTYTRDDGQVITGLEWTPDARAIVYVRGGDANPALDPRGVEQAIWIAPLDGPPRRIAEGSSPAVSPTARRVAFLVDGEVWWAPLDSGEATQLIRTRGTASNLRWSPDGRRLAFTSSRGDHGYVGVYDTADSTLRYLSPSTDTDRYPVWAPDSRQVAFVRQPAWTRNAVRVPRRSGQPWSIWIADAVTGRGREVWRAEPGPGSVFRGVTSRDQLQWMANGLLVFPWEKDGWTHLYAVAVAGGERAVLLTPGDFEVEHVAVAPARLTLTFSSNQGDADRRHLWTVRVPSSTGPATLTTGTGIEWGPAPSSETGVTYFLRADARGPARPAVISTGGQAVDLVPQAIPADFPSAQLVTPQAVMVMATDGLPLHAQLFLPPDLRTGERRPAVLFFHGGPRTQMLLGWHPSQYYHQAYAFNQYLASRGYVVLSINYRSGTGYGMAFREVEGFGPTGATEFLDIQGAGRWLRARADVDSTRVGVWGGSWGGFMVALALARASDMFAAGVDLHGVHDWNLEWDPLVPGWDTEKDLAARRAAWEASPMAHLKNWRSPVLLIQGDDDPDVNFSNQVQLREDLRKQGVHVEEIVFPDEGHSFLVHRHWLEAYDAAVRFFDGILRGIRR